MVKIAGLELENVSPSLRTLLATEITHTHLTAAGSVSSYITTVLCGGSDRAVTLPASSNYTLGGAPQGTTRVILKVDAAGAGKVVLTPASGGTIGSAAADATWSSPASAVNYIVVVSTGLGGWTIAQQSGTWT